MATFSDKTILTTTFTSKMSKNSFYRAKSKAVFKFKSGRIINAKPYEMIELTLLEIEEMGQYLFNLFFTNPGTLHTQVELFNDNADILYEEWLRKKQIL